MKKFEVHHVKEIILWNEKEARERNESFGVNFELLDDIIEKVNSLSDIVDDKERVLKQMSILLGLIVFKQPFNNANKTTATATAIQFLRENGYELDLESENAQDELVRMLEGIMYLFEDQAEVAIRLVKTFLEKHLR
jgi:prophage maintenance system killer protein